MNNDRYVLALDPSGAYKEGLGTTGWCLLDQQTKKIVKLTPSYTELEDNNRSRSSKLRVIERVL